MPAIPTYPDAEMVAAAWIRSIPGIVVDAVDVQFPWDVNVPPAVNGYVQVSSAGGVPDQNVPLFHTTVQVDCWVLAPSEDRIFRLRASALAKQIQYATWDRLKAERGVEVIEQLSDGTFITYPNAHVYTAVCLTDAHPLITAENPSYEAYSFDMMFTWTTAMTVN